MNETIKRMIEEFRTIQINYFQELGEGDEVLELINADDEDLLKGALMVAINKYYDRFEEVHSQE